MLAYWGFESLPLRQRDKQLIVDITFFCFDSAPYHILPHIKFWISINRLGFKVLIETLLVAVSRRSRADAEIDRPNYPVRADCSFKHDEKHKMSRDLVRKNLAATDRPS